MIDKPGDIPVHPLRVWENGTLANALIGTFPELQGVGGNPLEPGLVHRLDRGTSGILVVGRNQPSWTALKQDLKYRRWTKKYLALVEGNLEREGLVDAALGPSSRRPPPDDPPEGPGNAPTGARGIRPKPD